MAEALVDVEAIKLAVEYVKKVVNITSVSVDNFKVEEFEDDGAHWVVSISFIDKGKDFNSIVGLMGGVKKYKVVTIDKTSGAILSMKIKTI